MLGVPVQDDPGAGDQSGSRSMFCAYTSSSGQTGLSMTYCVETPMKLESAIVPVKRLRPSAMLPASSACASDIFSGRTPTSSFPPAVGAVAQRCAGSRSLASAAVTTTSPPVLDATSASMRLEVPRKLATKVVCGFS